jgi:hypothetical protein
MLQRLPVWEDLIGGFAFISYSSADRDYVERLVAELDRRQVDSWYDRRIDSGHRWTEEIEAKIRACTVFVPVVTPGFVKSRWCESELHLAIELEKPMAPLLLAGPMPWILRAFQYEDVTHGGRPDERWFGTLPTRSAGEHEELASTKAPVSGARTTVEPTAEAAPPSALAPSSTSSYAEGSRRAAISNAVQQASTLACVTALGLALIYLLVLSPELGMRWLSVAAVVLAAIATAGCLVLYYRRAVQR